MTEFLMTTWDGAGTTPPLMSVARALMQRGHVVRVLADESLRAEVLTTGAEHIAWTRAPQRRDHTFDSHFVKDWAGLDPSEEFANMRDRLAVGPAAAFAADVRDELERRPAAAVLTETLLFGPLVAAEAAGVPCVVLNPTINLIPAPGVPPFGPGFLPAANDAERQRDAEVAAMSVAMWDEALPALNAARAEQGLEPLEHVLDQGRSAALVLVMTSRAFDFLGELPPTVKHVGPRLDDVTWAAPWTPPAGDGPLILSALSSDYQRQEDLLGRIVDALGQLPARGVVTTGRGLDPSTVAAPGNVQVVASAPHRDVLAVADLAITHCGHGTTIKALAAGVPLVCVPMGRDQNDVAARVVHAGAGVRLAPTATAGEIAAAAREVLADPAYRAAARRIGDAIAEETSTDQAVAEIEALVAYEYGSRAERSSESESVERSTSDSMASAR